MTGTRLALATATRLLCGDNAGVLQSATYLAVRGGRRIGLRATIRKDAALVSLFGAQMRDGENGMRCGCACRAQLPLDEGRSRMMLRLVSKSGICL